MGEGGGIAGQAAGRVFDREMTHPGVGPRSAAGPAHPPGSSAAFGAAEKNLPPRQPTATAASGRKRELARSFRQPVTGHRAPAPRRQRSALTTARMPSKVQEDKM